MKLEFDWQVPQVVWCEKCNHSWYQWRIAIIETFEITDDIKTLIVEWKTWIDLYAKARENWYLTLREDWIMKILKWETTLDEIRRVL
jgi:type II secretory ATPase GspE/PulE/Tfp pilus assembly ATPase PilB-like protein